MDLKSIMLSERSQMGKDKTISFHSYGEDKTKITNELTKQNHRYRQWNSSYQRGRELHKFDKGGQIDGNGRKLDFGLGALNRCQIIMYS